MPKNNLSKRVSAFDVIREQLPRWWREQRELGDQTGAVSLPDVVESFVPQTPSDVALTVAGGPVGSMVRAGALGLAGATYAPDAEAAGGAIKSAGKVGGKIVNALKQPRRTAAETVAQGWKHPISGTVLHKPIGEFTREIENIPVEGMPARRFVRPEELQGSALIPALGDRTAAAQRLLGVNDTTFRLPVDLEGGPDFMRTHAPTGSAWASDKGVIANLARRTREAADAAGGDVNLVYVPMSHAGADYSRMAAETALNLMRPEQMRRNALRSFEADVRAIRPDYTSFDSLEALDEQLRTNAPVRRAFLNTLDKRMYKDAPGFPDMADVRFGITEPELLDTPIGHGGYAISRLDPTGQIIRDPARPHSTYNTQLGGEYRGGLEVPVPMDLLFRDFFAGRRAAGLPKSADQRALGMADVSQVADQQWVDAVSNYIEQQKRNALSR